MRGAGHSSPCPTPSRERHGVKRDLVKILCPPPPIRDDAGQRQAVHAFGFRRSVPRCSGRSPPCSPQSGASAFASESSRTCAAVRWSRLGRLRVADGAVAAARGQQLAPVPWHMRMRKELVGAAWSRLWTRLRRAAGWRSRRERMQMLEHRMCELPCMRVGMPMTAAARPALSRAHV